MSSANSDEVLLLKDYRFVPITTSSHPRGPMNPGLVISRYSFCNFTANTGSIRKRLCAFDPISPVATGRSTREPDIVTTRWIPEDEEVTLSELLSPEFKIETKKSGIVSFCQYMASPLITKRPHPSFFASGPRLVLVEVGGGGQQETERDRAEKKQLGFW